MEQSLEVDGPEEESNNVAATRRDGGPNPAPNDEKARTAVTWEGCQEGKSFEGKAPLGKERRRGNAAVNRKRGEPHGRLQGAIDLQGPERSKPSQSGGTTRTERVWSVAAPGRRRASARREWTHRILTGGGAIFE
jgi:hypothetical protein